MTEADSTQRGSLLPDEQEQIDRTTTNQRLEDEPKQRQWFEWVRDPRHLTVIFTGAIALLTAIYVLITFWQFSLMREQLEIAHRARVFVVLPDPAPSIELGKPTTVRLEFKNTGSLPAVLTSGTLEVDLLWRYEDYGDKAMEVEDGRFVAITDVEITGPLNFAIIPGGTSQFDTASIPALGNADLDELEAGGLVIRVAVVLSYNDGFVGNRTTAFCMLIIPGQHWWDQPRLLEDDPCEGRENRVD